MPGGQRVRLAHKARSYIERAGYRGTMAWVPMMLEQWFRLLVVCFRKYPGFKTS